MNNIRKASNIDVAVLLIFFTRVEQTKAVFNEIKKARPSKLFLYQDGPRSTRIDDMSNIQLCRNIVEDIDWDCQIYRLYQDRNFGCDPSEYIAQKWMFSYVEKGIVLEDDDVPSQSFFVFCKELLDKYEYDERINMICGMNNLGEYDCPYDYFFAQGGSIWGWASWKRVIDEWDAEYGFLDDEYVIRSLRLNLNQGVFNDLISICKKHKQSKKEHYESILGSNVFVNGRLNIIPTKNMIRNIGIGSETTHSVSDMYLLPRSIRKIMNMETYDITFPLKHPSYVVNDRHYIKLVKQMLNGNFFVKTLKIRKLEGWIYKIFPYIGKM